MCDLVRNGYSILPLALCENQNIRLKRIVKKISYNRTGVEVSVENGEDAKHEMIETYRAEAVLVTVPLGVLKEKVIVFDPPLPEEKQSAIDRLGFGNLNKVRRASETRSANIAIQVVLCFDKVFWDANHTLFAHVNASTSSRGELFLFWCFTKPPVLIALVAGDAANVVECATDDVIIGRTLVVLRNIFGSVTVPSVGFSSNFFVSHARLCLAQRISRHPLEIRPIRAWLVLLRRCGRVG